MTPPVVPAAGCPLLRWSHGTPVRCRLPLEELNGRGVLGRLYGRDTGPAYNSGGHPAALQPRCARSSTLQKGRCTSYGPLEGAAEGWEHDEHHGVVTSKRGFAARPTVRLVSRLLFPPQQVTKGSPYSPRFLLRAPRPPVARSCPCATASTNSASRSGSKLSAPWAPPSPITSSLRRPARRPPA